MGTFGKENNDMTNLSKPYNDVIIAPAENGATSLRPYSVNAFARVRGVLKRVTAAIAAGEPFSSGNSVNTTVGDELKYLRDTTTQINTDLSVKPSFVDWASQTALTSGDYTVTSDCYIQGLVQTNANLTGNITVREKTTQNPILILQGANTTIGYCVGVYVKAGTVLDITVAGNCNLWKYELV